LSNGRAHVVIADKRIFSFYQKQITGVSIDAFTFHPIFPASRYRVAFKNKKIRNAFNKALRILETKSLLQTIEKKYK
jgi:polar amino acid transport system substrate-binding protein